MAGGDKERRDQPRETGIRDDLKGEGMTPGSDMGGVAEPTGTVSGIGGSGGDARGGVTSGGSPASPRGRIGGGTGGQGPAADVTGAGGPATPPPDNSDVADAGTSGVTGMGSSAIGHPSGATGGDASATEGSDTEEEISREHRERGIVSQHRTSIVGAGPAVREAGVLDTGGEPSGMTGATGSGSTTTVPGGGTNRSTGTISGTTGTGAGGTTPGGSVIGDAGVRGAGARSDGSPEKKEDEPRPRGPVDERMTRGQS
jgi:hypothetical protein